MQYICLVGTHLSSPRVDSPNPTREPRRDWWWCGNHILVESRRAGVCQSGCRSGAVELQGVCTRARTYTRRRRTGGAGLVGLVVVVPVQVGCYVNNKCRSAHTTCKSNKPGSKEGVRTNERTENSKAKQTLTAQGPGPKQKPLDRQTWRS